MYHLSSETVSIGKSVEAFIQAVIASLFAGTDKAYDFRFQEKLRKQSDINSYRYPTLVDWSSRPRRAREYGSRNSANYLGVPLEDTLPTRFLVY